MKKILLGILFGLLLSFSQFQESVFAAEVGESQTEQVRVERTITGTVYKYQYIVPRNELVPCENYQVYLLPASTDQKAELLLNSKQPDFSITVAEEKLKQASAIEFVSHYGSTSIAINEIKDLPLKVVLEPEMFVKKPAIYLYPEKKQKIVVTHEFKGKLVTTYPAYKDNWTVIAEKDGILLNQADNRKYKYLFWDGVYAFPEEHYNFQTGFYVAKADYISFLEHKLAYIGLNESEINDFVVYWLPEMNKFEHCFVHFRINDDIDGSSVLKTKPAADTVIRVFMEFSGLNDFNAASFLPEQVLPQLMRKGFTLVEWGGSEINTPFQFKANSEPNMQNKQATTSLGKSLETGFLGLKWGAKPAEVAGPGATSTMPGLTFYTADLDLSPILGEVKATSEPRLVFDQKAGFVQAHVDLASADYDMVDKQLHELLGQPVAIVYEKYSVDNTLLQMSEWYLGSSVKVVLENRFTGAMLEISKRDLF
ncbi:MAG: hypothetical protein AB7E34_05135 [Acidaminococcaceae bacterium]